jgi:soluble cytochrome b562
MSRIRTGKVAARFGRPTQIQNYIMKLHRLFATVLATAALALPAFAEDTPLTEEMEKLSKTLKSIGRAAKEGNVPKDLAAKVDDAKKACEAGLKFEPAKTTEIPAAEKAKFLADYKASMQETIKTLDELKVAIEAGKTEDVNKALEKLNMQKKDGHKKFQKEE